MTESDWLFWKSFFQFMGPGLLAMALGYSVWGCRKLVGRGERKKLGARVIKMLEDDPDGWQNSRYTFNYGTFEMWMMNRPYADIKIYSTGLDDVRIGTRAQRRKIRWLVDRIKTRRQAETLGLSRAGFNGLTVTKETEAAVMEGVDELLRKVRLGR